MARTPPGAVTSAKTRRLPPPLTQANTSQSNVLLSNSAQFTRGVLSFSGSLFSSSLLAAAWGASFASAPVWVNERSGQNGLPVVIGVRPVQNHQGFASLRQHIRHPLSEQTSDIDALIGQELVHLSHFLLSLGTSGLG